MVSKSRQSPREVEILGMVCEAQTQTEMPAPWETKNSLKVELMSPEGKLLEKECLHDGVWQSILSQFIEIQFGTSPWEVISLDNECRCVINLRAVQESRGGQAKHHLLYL